jgi:KaiC/GvpD/RAD55 family RecA-like ATPase
MSVNPADIPGLDLVLGGGIPAVSRGDGLNESATLLVRGPPGSGKSILGTQLAGALARRLFSDVAYGCIELLPHELRAQHCAFARVYEQVVVPPFTGQSPRHERGALIFAATLDLGDPKGERDKLGGATLELVDIVTACGGKPRVLVIDSLSDGYGLGASAPRELADGVCKMAAELGMFVLLLEETVDGRPSSWSFATDIVLELEAPRAGMSRSMTVVKNRFGASDPGPHELAIEPSVGVRIFPQPSCYLAPWAKVLEGPPSQTPWVISVPGAQMPTVQASVVAVHGSDPGLVFDVVRPLGKVHQGVDVVVDFGRQGPGAFDVKDSVEAVIWAGDPFLSGNRLLERVTAVLQDQRRPSLDRVLIGDFRSIRTFVDPAGIRRAVGVIIALLRRAGIPAILFETTAGPSTIAGQLLVEGAGTNTPELASETVEPEIVDFADVLIEVATDRSRALTIVTDVRGQRRYSGNLTPLHRRGTPGR